MESPKVKTHTRLVKAIIGPLDDDTVGDYTVISIVADFNNSDPPIVKKVPPNPAN